MVFDQLFTLFKVCSSIKAYELTQWQFIEIVCLNKSPRIDLVFDNIRRKLYFQIALEVQQSKFKVRHKNTKKERKGGEGKIPRERS